MEQQITKSIQEMLTQLENIADKKKADIFWPIQLCVGNVINEILFGFHYKYEKSEKFQKFVKVVDTHLRHLLGMCSFFVSAFPILKYVPIIGELGHHRIVRNISSVSENLVESQNGSFSVPNIY